MGKISETGNKKTCYNERQGDKQREEEVPESVACSQDTEGNIMETFRIKRNLLIKQWYDQECFKIALQSRSDDIQISEKIRIYHHEIHQKLIKKSAILKLDTDDGLIEGHEACASFLINSVAQLLQHPAQLDHDAQQILLDEMEPVFTEADNKLPCTIPNNAGTYLVII